MTLSTVSGSSWVTWRLFGMPALFTRMSTPPSSSIATEARPSTSAGTLRSTPHIRLLGLGVLHLSKVSFSRSARLAQIPTTAPSRASASAKAAPIPDDAPVTSTFFPSNERLICKLLPYTAPARTRASSTERPAPSVQTTASRQRRPAPRRYSVRRGEERVVKRVDRRTFLANSLRTGVAVVAAGSIAYEEWTVAWPVPGATGSSGRATGRAIRGQPSALSINGDSAPVGVDPDDTSFAWELGDPAKGALQSAYRITLSQGGKQIWDSGEESSNRQALVSYKGPALSSDTAHNFTVATRNAKGDWSPTSEAASFITGLRQSDWSAVWLRPGPSDTGLEQYTYLRKTFDLPSGIISHAVVYTAAAHKYQLWLNGQKRDTGPSFCYPDEQYVQATDVSGTVVAGARNTLGFLHHWYSAGKGRPASAPGLLAQLSVRYTDGRHVTVGTDGTWRQQKAEWLPAPPRNTDAGDFVEIIDGRASPLGWANPSFDDSAWSPALVLGPVGTEPFTGLFVQRTRITELEIAAVSVTTLEGGAVVVDFGKIYAARPTVEFRGGVAGRMIPMHVGYVLDPDGHVSTTNDTQATDLAL